ncbi:MAG: sensor histidine kinase KdpD [Myxococcales bacterium]|nr:sensor histidine kinase KdpD [Myxococcales bacterium]
MVDEAPTRPDPDALLARLKAEEHQRARLKIFFGFAPGVGKTFAMLESARRLKASGLDVVIGLVETHGRSETARLMEGLELLPRQQRDYRGKRLEEFDLERALARKPAILLVDELAHTNVPGSRHTRRWQDVLELLDAGIEVHTTLNVQHVESLNDVVAQITHVQVRETVPDSLLERADEIELIDLPPEELLKRMSEGKVYLPEQARRATESFFRRGNLLALRELALRRTAERVDDDVIAYRQQHEIKTTWPSGDRIAVCVGPAPASERLVRAARRMAAGLRAPWFALWVDNPVAAMSQADRGRLESHLRLVATLGGEVVRLSSARVGEAILDWARTHNITRIILGKPTHSPLRDALRGSLLTTIVRGSLDIDVLVISGDPVTPAQPVEPVVPARSARLSDYGVSALTIGALTGIALVLQHLLGPPDLEMLFLLGIMVLAATLGRGPALLASALAVAAYDFFFVPPLLTFAVADTRFFLTFFMMFGVASVISALASRLRTQEREARQRERQTQTLLAFTRALSEADTVDGLARTTARYCAEAIAPPASVVVLMPHDGALKPRGAWPIQVELEPADLGVAQWVHDHGRSAGKGTDTLSAAQAYCFPLARRQGVIALLGAGQPRVEERTLLDSFARQAAVSVERFHLAEEARAAALRARTEELRSSLLSGVSHDLRTPLAVVTGAATALRDDAALDPSTRAQLLGTICDEAERLERLVRNLLEMTRLQAGALTVKREWVPPEELVGSARSRLTRQLSGREVHVSLPDGLPLIPVDPVLFEQVLLNLLENALKYTPPGTPIDVAARALPDSVELEVADRGPGFNEADGERLFQKFFRGAPRGTSGAGLGLAVCRGIVEAHGGRVIARLREGGGARFIISLPLLEIPPSVPPEEET